MKRFKVTVTIDRPIGYRDNYGNIYPMNYGYVAGIIAGDSEEQDVYVLKECEKLETFTGEVIAIIVRRNDVEDKWVVAQPGTLLSKEKIMNQTDFIEKYFDSEVLLLQ